MFWNTTTLGRLAGTSLSASDRRKVAAIRGPVHDELARHGVSPLRRRWVAAML